VTVAPQQAATAAANSSGQVYHVETFPGATADVQFANCIAALSGGGTCDATGYGATTQTIASQVNLGNSSHSVITFIFNPATVFVPGTGNMTMFHMVPGASVLGTIHTSLNSSFTGNAVSFAGNTYSNQANGQSNDASPSVFEGLICAGQGNTTGTCLYLQGTNGSTEWLEFQHFGKINISGMLYGVHAYSATNGWVNGNDFDSIMCSNTVYCTVMESGSLGNIFGNVFKLIQPEGFNGYTRVAVDGVWLKGTGAITGNYIYEVAWDWVNHSTCPTCNTFRLDSNTLSNGTNNYVAGIIDLAQTTDPNNAAFINDLSTGQMQGPYVIGNGSMTAPYFNSTGSNNYRVGGNVVMANDGKNTYLTATGGSLYLQTAGHNLILDATGNLTVPGSINSTGSNNYQVGGKVVMANDGKSTYLTATGGSLYLQTAGHNLILDATGNLTVPGSAYATAFNQTSDERLKTDIKTISPEEGLNKILQLNAYRFHWKDQAKMGKATQIGVLAQDVEKVFPEVVATKSDGFKSVSYSSLVAPLIAAVAALEKENSALKTQNESLKQQQLEFDTRLKKIEEVQIRHPASK